MIIIAAIGIMITWTDWIVGMFKIAHPEVYTIADVGFIFGGPILRDVFGIMYWVSDAPQGDGLSPDPSYTLLSSQVLDYLALPLPSTRSAPTEHAQSSSSWFRQSSSSSLRLFRRSTACPGSHGSASPV